MRPMNTVVSDKVLFYFHFGEVELCSFLSLFLAQWYTVSAVLSCYTWDNVEIGKVFSTSRVIKLDITTDLLS